MSLLNDALGVLGKVAPTIATMLGGPLAGTAVSAIESALGLDPSGDKDAALKAVAAATPEQLLALKAEDNRHAEAMEKLGLDRDALAAQDRDSARKREMEVKDRVPGILAISLTLGFFGLLGWLVAHEPPQGSRDILNIMLGSLGTGWITMLAYYFGSSADTKRFQLQAAK
ncbi:conserved protein of unknown function [Magnetospirillum sp. XM-1]|uniref:hypothetical protein n=1 Tax=Magnetospirillum sp. XM-1 TaxID=1663591 RepID=UPI00073DCCD2|nr:hypothetical protein [Magnetospirillum sp. XM-1]CUW39661.1 conserved protein of unknown function [Magnetospirillum sp. XM-1]